MQYIKSFVSNDFPALEYYINNYLQTYPNRKVTMIKQIYDNSALFDRFKILVCFEEEQNC